MQSAPALVRVLGRTARSVGIALDELGLSLSPHVTRDTLVPSTRVVPLRGRELAHGKAAFVASSATVVGDVQIGEHSSVWYGAVVRGDAAPVRMGRNVAVLDNAQVSGAQLGNDVVIAPGARVAAAAVIGEGAMVGMGAQVLAGARVGSDSFVDAGAVVAAGTVVPSGQLWTGVPARHLRALAPAEVAYLRSSALSYADLSAVHCAQGAKGPEAVEEDEELRWAKIEGGYAPNIPVSLEDPDVIQYYKLTEKHANPGLWRDAETDVAAELKRKEAEEIAADRAEEAYYNALARNKRVVETLNVLVSARPAAGALEGALQALARRDAEGEGMVLALMQRATEASRAGAPPLAKEEVLRTLRALNPAAPAEEAPLQLQALVAHGAAAAGARGSN